MKFKRVDYRIADRIDGSKPVSGFAVQADADARFAVRQVIRGYWIADHWDTGFRLAAGHSRQDAAENAVKALKFAGPEKIAEALKYARENRAFPFDA